MKYKTNSYSNKSLIMKNLWQQPEFRDKMVRMIRTRGDRGYIPWNKGKPHTVLKDMGYCFKKGNIPWNKGKKGVQVANNITRAKISIISKKLWQNEQYRKMMIIKHKKVWENPEFKRKMLSILLKSLFKRPTSFEKKIIDLITKYNLPYKYVGNGQVIIDSLNPDFINTDGQKILIESYCKYWHPNNYEEQRIKRFAKYGFKIIFLNDNDLKREDWEQICLNKIQNV